MAGNALLARVSEGASGDALVTRFVAGRLGAVFRFMFFDAPEPLYFGRFQAFYVFWLVCAGFGEDISQRAHACP